MDRENEIRVAICICTFRRQRKLGDLLGGIAQLTFRKVPTPKIDIVVVDNDEFASAKEVCQTVSIPWPVRYVVEPRRGITYARNRSITASGSVDFAAFIDDDEIPSPQWMDELLWAQAEFNADVVSGPVVPRFAPKVAEWVRSGGFFDARVAATGSLRATCASNNVLIATHVFRRVPKFDDRFALSGAEDTDFFLRAHRAGCRIVWSQEAAVFETVSRERGNVAWLLRREYQTGNGWVFCEAGLDNGIRTWMLRFAKGCGHVTIGFLKAMLSAIMLNMAAVVRSLQRASLGTGMLAALVGHRFLAYQNPSPIVIETPKPGVQA